MPIESAFILATSSDIRLWEEAWRKNVLLVCPSTFLFVVRTVNHLWRQEHQNRNVQEIAERGGALYDKFVGFVEDLQSVGQRLAQTKDSYDKAFGKLSTGRGNLVRQAENLRDLGVRPARRLPTALVLAGSRRKAATGRRERAIVTGCGRRAPVPRIELRCSLGCLFLDFGSGGVQASGSIRFGGLGLRLTAIVWLHVLLQ